VTRPDWPRTWVLASSSLNNIASTDKAVAHAAFDTPAAYVTALPGAATIVPAGYAAVPTLNYKSYAKFAADVQAGRIPPEVKAVLYDPEAWDLTPVVEQQGVGYYMAAFAALADNQGLTTIMTPATDLMNAWPKAKQETNLHAFVRYGIAGAAAASGAAIVEVQAQAYELDLPTYRAYIEACVMQVVDADPTALFIAGLDRSAIDTTQTADQLFAAANSVRDLVDGFFLNVAQTPPAPGNAAGLLRLLGYS
jgi:hypothetical protein